MSAKGVPPSMTLRGWGLGVGSASNVEPITTSPQVADAVRRARDGHHHLLGRGLGRSYGDAAQCAGGVVLDMTGLRDVVAFDATTGQITIEAGMSLLELLRLVVPLGWFVPVTPGTAHVTVGGAIAANVHGKNHHVDGSFGQHVTHLAIETPLGTQGASASSNELLFWSTLGAMGLTGIVTQATMALIPIESSYMTMDTDRTSDLDETLAVLASTDENYRYSVAWVDCLSSSARLGRSVITSANHATRAVLDGNRGTDPLHFELNERVSVPFIAPFNLVRPHLIRAFNEAWFRHAPKRRRDEIVPLAGFFYPLDGLGDWNRLYGRSGFTQYQFVVPPDASDLVRTAIERLRSAGHPPLLAVLKRFGDGDLAPLSFPMRGWTLAIDLALRPGLGVVLDELDELVARAGGRVYLAKDGRLRPDLVTSMYPRLDAWRAVKAEVDPSCVFSSDLSRRLELTNERD